TGDDGTTGLTGGERRLKSDLRVAAFGTVDETSAAVGMARVHTERDHPGIDAMLRRIQNDLFDLGADLSTPEGGRKGGPQALRVVAAQVERLEREIDTLNAGLAPLTSFVLPGGTPAAAALHLARTIARRAERLMVELDRTPGEKLGEEALRYINRLSDFLFVAARSVNGKGAYDVLWVPGENR